MVPASHVPCFLHTVLALPFLLRPQSEAAIQIHPLSKAPAGCSPGSPSPVYPCRRFGRRRRRRRRHRLPASPLPTLPQRPAVRQYIRHSNAHWLANDAVLIGSLVSTRPVRPSHRYNIYAERSASRLEPKPHQCDHLMLAAFETCLATAWQNSDADRTTRGEHSGSTVPRARCPSRLASGLCTFDSSRCCP